MSLNFQCKGVFWTVHLWEVDIALWSTTETIKFPLSADQYSIDLHVSYSAVVQMQQNPDTDIV